MKDLNRDVKIIRLEGSDILKIQHNKKVELNFETVLPYSLLKAKMDRLKIKFDDNKSLDVLGVNFNFGYSTAELFKIQKQIEEVREKIKCLKNLIFNLNYNIKNNEEHNFEKKILEEIVKNNDVLKLQQQRNELLEQEKEEKNKYNKDKIRKILYKDGFSLTHIYKEKGKEIRKTINYKFWFRTPAKSRVGDSLFINEAYKNDIEKWQNMGLTLPSGETKVVEFEAYRSLTASHIEDTIKINPKNILVVNDLDSFFKTNITSIEMKNNNCIAVERPDYVKNTLWDGMSLLDSSYFPNKHFKLLRQHMFKGCAFKANVIQFLKNWCIENQKDYNSFQVKDRYGNNMRIKDVHLITTENSMKFEKFSECGATINTKNGIVEITSKKQMYSYWKKCVIADKNLFGVCKSDHISKYNNYQRMSYQMVNTLLLDPTQTSNLAQHTVDYIEQLKENDNIFIQMLKDTSAEGNNNMLIVDLYNKSNNFKSSKFYKDFKTETISSIKKRVRKGKILVEGDNLTVCGNPIALLFHAVGEIPHKDGKIDPTYKDNTLPVLADAISCYTNRFSNNEDIAGFRNPHNAPNNIALLHNTHSNLMSTYTDFGNNVVAINMINTETQPCMNGLDEDSDFALCTNNNIVVEATRKIFRQDGFNCIVNNIPTSSKKWVNNLENIAKIDNILAKSKNDIGITSNLAQLALSYYQLKKSDELKNIVCIMSVLAQVAIDNAKRQYSVDVEKEIKEIFKLDCIKEFNKKLPKWMLHTKKDVKKEKLYHKDVCTMDYLENVVDTIKNIKNNKSNLKNESILVDNIILDGKTNYLQIEKIKSLVENYDKQVKFKKQEATKYNWTEKKIEKAIEIERDTAVNRIAGLKLTKETMFYLVRNAITESNKNDVKKYKRKMLNVLYTTHKELFLSMFM